MRKCECGCGQPTKLVTKTSKQSGYKKGDYLRFINGHNANPAKIVAYSKTIGVWNKGLTKETDMRVIAPWEGKKRPNFPKGIPHLSAREKLHYRWVLPRTSLKTSEKKHLDSQYRVWMFGVKNRDGWKCKIADMSCDGRMEAHHILNWIEFPELRYKVNNGITLCHAHHPRGRAEEKRLAPELQALVSVSKVQIG